jgi:H+/Cl- antiporter ClcA
MYESLEDRMRAVVAVFSLIAAVALVAVVADFLQMHLATRLEEGYTLSRDRNDARQAGIGWVELVLFVSGAAVFVRWLWGAYHNAAVREATRRLDRAAAQRSAERRPPAPEPVPQL